MAEIEALQAELMPLERQRQKVRDESCSHMCCLTQHASGQLRRIIYGKMSPSRDSSWRSRLSAGRTT